MKKATRAVQFLGFVLVIYALSACNGSPLFFQNFQSDRQENLIATIADGVVHSSSDPFLFTLDYDAAYIAPDTLRIALIDDEGNEVALTELPAEGIEPGVENEINLPVVPEGLYKLVFELYGDDVLLDTRTVTFFIVSEEYRLDGIFSYPSRVNPDSTVILRADYTVPGASEPYLRWTLGDRLLTQGLLADGYDDIFWNVPRVSGVYTVTVELFPFAPPEGVEFDFQSSVRLQTEIFVSDSVIFLEGDLFPEDDYSVLYHFWGNLRNRGTDSDVAAVSPESIGVPRFAARDSRVGYRFDGESGFRFPVSLLPTDESSLLPFMLTLSFRPETVEARQNLLSLQNDGEAQLSLYLEDEGVPTLAVRDGESAAVFISPIRASIDRYNKLVLFCVPSDGLFEVYWFMDGFFYGKQALEWSGSEQSSSPEWTTVLGGQDSLLGIVDELGVRTLDADTPLSTGAVLAMELGDRIVAGLGVTGVPAFPRDADTDGVVRLGSESLSLETSAAIAWPDLPVGAEGLSFEIAPLPEAATDETEAESVQTSSIEADESGLSFVIEPVEGGASFSLRFTPEGLVFSGDTTRVVRIADRVRLAIRPATDGFEILCSGLNEESFFVPGPAAGLDWSLVNEGSSTVGLDYLLVFD